jgi:hypothetical protein
MLFRKLFFSLISASFFICLNGQIVSKSSVTGLHGQVTWLSDTKVRIVYDWSDDSQLLDWSTTEGSRLVRGNGTVTITGGLADVRSMVLKQYFKTERIYVRDAMAVNASVAHLNLFTNVFNWTGYSFNPEGMIGLMYTLKGNYWLMNGGLAAFTAPDIELGKKYTIDVNVSNSQITTICSTDNLTYSYPLTVTQERESQTGVGGYGGDTQWGTLTIEGVIKPALKVPSDMIHFLSVGSEFAPHIEVTGTPLIEWVFGDSTLSSSDTPVKDYSTNAAHHTYLRVTPWSALTGINIGYDAADDGYGGFSIVPNQDVTQIDNLNLAGGSLKYLCASHNPLTDLDLKGLTGLKFIELLECRNLTNFQLGDHPLLERLCVENDNINTLNLSGCASLADLRAASNIYTSINWGSAGPKLWHICVRTNPQLNTSVNNLTLFPALTELLNWNANQKGALICHSAIMKSIESNDNQYTSADLSGCTGLKKLSISRSKLASINIGSANNLVFVELKDCGLSRLQTDYVLNTLDRAGQTGGYLDLSGNTVPSGDGLINYNNLLARGWTIDMPLPVTSIVVSPENGVTTISKDQITLKLNATVLPESASDKKIIWSVINVTGQASIDANGLLTAISGGSVIVKATANDGSDVSGTIKITIDRPEAMNISITSDLLTVRVSDNLLSARISLLNIHGRIIESRNIESNVNTFSVSSLPSGIYFLSVAKNVILCTGKVIKP